MKLVLDAEKELAKALQGMTREEFIARFSPTEPEYIKTCNQLMGKKAKYHRSLPMVADTIMLDRGNTAFLKKLCEQHRQRPGIVLNSLITAARLGLPYQIQNGQDVALAASLAMKVLRDAENAAINTYHAKLSPKPMDQVHWAFKTNKQNVQVMCASSWFPKTTGLKYTKNPGRITCEECLEAERMFNRDPSERQKRWVETDNIRKRRTPDEPDFNGRGSYPDRQPSSDDAIHPADLGIVAEDL